MKHYLTSTNSGATRAALLDELSKIAEATQKPSNERLKKFMKSTAIIGAGTGLGYGAAMLADKGLSTALGSRWATLGTPAQKKLVGALLGLASSGAFVGREWLGHERKEAAK